MSAPEIPVYTQPYCQPCKRTVLVLDRAEVPYSTVDVSSDPQALEAIKELGYAQAPVVIVSNGDTKDETHWSGLRPDMPPKEDQSRCREGSGQLGPRYPRLVWGFPVHALLPALTEAEPLVPGEKPIVGGDSHQDRARRDRLTKTEREL